MKYMCDAECLKYHKRENAATSKADYSSLSLVCSCSQLLLPLRKIHHPPADFLRNVSVTPQVSTFHVPRLPLLPCSGMLS